MSKARQLAQKPNQPTGRKNLIINGAMQVFQRGNSKDTISNDDCTADRWAVQGISSLDQANVDYDRTGVGQTDTSVPDGFANALKISLDASETTLESSEYVILLQKLEGQDLQHLRKGFSDAKKLTLSFWVRSSVASTYTVEFKDNDNTRNIGKTYTVNAADTWEYKTITIEGDTTGKFDNDNNLSLAVMFWLDAGSAFTSSTFSTAWQAQDTDERVFDTTGWAESSSPTFYITGVQLEVGSTATEFEHRSYGEELQLCKRYFQKGSIDRRWTSTGSNEYNRFTIFYPVEMRGTVDAAFSGGSFGNIISSTENTSAENSTGISRQVTYRANATNTDTYVFNRTVEFDSEL